MLNLILNVVLQSTAIPAANCAWATAEEMPGLQVSVLQPEAYEPGSTEQGLAHVFIVRVTRVARGPGCLQLRWRAVPRGRNPANAADFRGGQWPSGVVQLAAWPTPTSLNPTEVEFRIVPGVDAIAEPNETFGIELTDRNGKVLWGSEQWQPEIAGRSLLWNNDSHRGGAVLTLHDAGRTCRQPRPGERFAIVKTRAAWPGIFVERPNRPITQCETLRWRLSPGGARPLRASDFAGGQFPTGTLRFNSDATSGEGDQQDSLPIRFSLRNRATSHGRTATIILESSNGMVARSTVSLD